MDCMRPAPPSGPGRNARPAAARRMPGPGTAPAARGPGRFSDSSSAVLALAFFHFVPAGFRTPGQGHRLAVPGGPDSVIAIRGAGETVDVNAPARVAPIGLRSVDGERIPDEYVARIHQPVLGWGQALQYFEVVAVGFPSFIAAGKQRLARQMRAGHELEAAVFLRGRIHRDRGLEESTVQVAVSRIRLAERAVLMHLEAHPVPGILVMHLIGDLAQVRTQYAHDQGKQTRRRPEAIEAGMDGRSPFGELERGFTADRDNPELG